MKKDIEETFIDNRFNLLSKQRRGTGDPCSGITLSSRQEGMR